MNKGNVTIFGHSAAILTICIWGTTFISTKLMLQTCTPITILCIRFIMGYLVLWMVCPHYMHLKHKKEECYFALAGICGVGLYYLLENIALTYTSASNVGVIISIAPFFTALCSFFILKEETIGYPFIIGFVLALIGMCCISFQNDNVQINPIGDMLAFLAAIIWALYSTIMKKISSFHYPTIQTTRRTFFYGLLFMLPIALCMDFRVNIAMFIDIRVLGNLLYLGIGASALCFVTWNFAILTLGSVKTSVYIYMVPVITAITSAIILKESLTNRMIIGILCILIGLCISGKKKFIRSKKNGKTTK